jgi:hypothetical protein
VLDSTVSVPSRHPTYLQSRHCAEISNAAILKKDDVSGEKAPDAACVGISGGTGMEALAGGEMIRKLSTGEYRLYSRKKNPKTGKRRNLGTFSSMEKAKAHERAVQFFKRN